jgi:hypothetical protein
MTLTLTEGIQSQGLNRSDLPGCPLIKSGQMQNCFKLSGAWDSEEADFPWWYGREAGAVGDHIPSSEQRQTLGESEEDILYITRAPRIVKFSKERNGPRPAKVPSSNSRRFSRIARG